MMKNVLVVDSDQVILRTLTSLLKNQGGFLNVFAATNTRQAINLLQKTPVDLVITAIRLPKVDGFRLVSKLTKDYPSIKVIIMRTTIIVARKCPLKHFGIFLTSLIWSVLISHCLVISLTV